MRQNFAKLIIILSILSLLSLSIRFPLPVRALSDTTYYIHTDHLGSVIAVTKDDGSAVSQSKYEPYGRTAIEQFNNGAMRQSPVTEHTYTGQIKDSRTTLSYYNARYYDPVLSRFISADSVNDQQNRYAYVGENPVMRNDPSGNQGLIPDPDNPYLKKETKPPDPYSSQFFKSLIQKKMFNTPEMRRDWQKMTSEEKVNQILNFVSQNPFNEQYFKIRSQIRQNEFMIKNNPTLTSEDVERLTNQSQELSRQFDKLMQQFYSTNPEELYNKKSFICHNYAQLAAAYITDLVPNVDVYTFSYSYNESGSSMRHVKVAVRFGEKTTIQIGDPTSGRAHGLQPLSEFIKHYPLAGTRSDNPIDYFKYTNYYQEKGILNEGLISDFYWNMPESLTAYHGFAPYINEMETRNY